MNKIGSLYQVKQYYWHVFTNKEKAGSSLLVTNMGREADAAAFDAHYKKYQDCNATYVSPNDLVVLLEFDEKFKKILSCNGEIGWTWVAEGYNDCFEEVKK